jgi:hypothetical protein
MKAIAILKDAKLQKQQTLQAEITAFIAGGFGVADDTAFKAELRKTVALGGAGASDNAGAGAAGTNALFDTGNDEVDWKN